MGSPSELIAALPGDHVIELELEKNTASALTADELGRVTFVKEAHLSAEGAWSLAVREPEHAVAAVLALLERKGCALGRLGTRKASLEDVFVALTGRHLRDG